MDVRISRHAREEMERRSIPMGLVESVLRHPQQIVPQRGRTRAYPSKVECPGGSVYLLRAIVNEDTDPPTLVTVYRTGKIGKYWRAHEGDL
jgi:hypothetical protein